MRFVCLSNVMSPSQAGAHGLALSRASKNIEAYTALKNLILSSVLLECNTDLNTRDLNTQPPRHHATDTSRGVSVAINWTVQIFSHEIQL